MMDQPRAAILFRRHGNWSRDLPLTVYRCDVTRQIQVTRLPVTSPFHRGTPSIPAKPKTLSRQKKKNWIASFTPASLFLGHEHFHTHLDRSLGGPQVSSDG
jgi:hypothetical protein